MANGLREQGLEHLDDVPSEEQSDTLAPALSIRPQVNQHTRSLR